MKHAPFSCFSLTIFQLSIVSCPDIAHRVLVKETQRCMNFRLKIDFGFSKIDFRRPSASERRSPRSRICETLIISEVSSLND